MRSCLVILLLFSVVSLVHISEAARKGPEDYWKGIMKDEPMPKALTDLYHEDSPSDALQHHNSNDNQKQPLSSKTLHTKRFLTNFDTSPNLIIYRTNFVIH